MEQGWIGDRAKCPWSLREASWSEKSVDDDAVSGWERFGMGGVWCETNQSIP